MKDDSNCQIGEYDGGPVSPDESGYSPTRKQCRYLLGWGYSPEAIIQLNRGQAQALIQAIADNGSEPERQYREWAGPLPKLIARGLSLYYDAIRRPVHVAYDSTRPKQLGNLHERMKYTIELTQRLDPNMIPNELRHAVYDLQTLVKRSEPIELNRIGAST